MAHGGARPAAAAALKRRWADPEFRARMVEQRRQSLARLWADPEYRARQTTAIARAHEDSKERRNEAIRLAWADPAVRKRAGEAIRRAWARRQGGADAEVDVRERERNRKPASPRCKHVPTPQSDARRQAPVRTRLKRHGTRYRIEIVRYASAPWAPRAHGMKWAWRVTSPAGNQVAGACRGTRAHAQQQADNTRRRMNAVTAGVWHHTEYVVNPRTHLKRPSEAAA